MATVSLARRLEGRQSAHFSNCTVGKKRGIAPSHATPLNPPMTVWAMIRPGFRKDGGMPGVWTLLNKIKLKDNNSSTQEEEDECERTDLHNHTISSLGSTLGKYGRTNICTKSGEILSVPDNVMESVEIFPKQQFYKTNLHTYRKKLKDKWIETPPLW